MTGDWQPIETAPKDGTEFLAYDSHCKKMDVAVMSKWLWGWECVAVQQDMEGGAMTDEFGYDSANIKHWMPLPDPPKP